jgi:ABC-type branched-subunit amino acid transport system ATPase component
MEVSLSLDLAMELNTRQESVRFEFARGWGWQQSRLTPANLARLGLGRTWQDIRLCDTQIVANNLAVSFPINLAKTHCGRCRCSVWMSRWLG